MTEQEKKLVRVVFHELRKLPYDKLNTILGSETIERMVRLSDKLNCEDFCKRKGIRYEDMTEADRLQKEEEDATERERQSDYDWLNREED